MNDLILIIPFIFIGFAAGMSSGLLGLGGGVIFLPALILLLPLTGVQHSNLLIISIATSVFAGSFSSTSAFFLHKRNKNVDMISGLLLIFGSIPAAVIMSQFFVDFNSEIIRYIIIVILFFVALKLFFEDGKISRKKFNLSKYYLTVVGGLVGVFSSISGLGGGVIYTPGLFYLFSFDIKKAIGTTTFAVACTMISLSISFAVHNNCFSYSGCNLGYLHLLAGVPLGFGAVFGARYGVKIQLKHSPSIIRKIFSVFLIVFIIKLILL